MLRRDFLTLTGIGLGGLIAPPFFGRTIVAEELSSRLDVALKKRLADAALDAATEAGCQLLRRAHRPLPAAVRHHPRGQSGERRQHRVHGCRRPRARQGHLGLRRHQRAHRRRGRRRRAAGRRDRQGQREGADSSRCSWPRSRGVGEVSWATPIRKNAMEVPVKEKVDLLLDVNAAAMAAPAPTTSTRSCSSSTSRSTSPPPTARYIDQDVHRIWPLLKVTAIDQKSGKFRTRDGLSAPMGMGYEYLDGARERTRCICPAAWSHYGKSYDMREDAIAAARQAREKLTAPSVKPGKYDLVLDPVAPVAHDPRIGRPSDRARPRARLRSQLRRHQLRHARQAEVEVQGTAATRSRCSPTRRRRAASARSATTTKA